MPWRNTKATVHCTPRVGINNVCSKNNLFNDLVRELVDYDHYHEWPLVVLELGIIMEKNGKIKTNTGFYDSKCLIFVM